MDFRLSSRNFIRLCSVVLILLLIGHLAGQISRFALGYDHLMGFVPLLSFYEEANVPTWVSGQLLFLAAVMLFLIGLSVRSTSRPFAYHWMGLAGIFAFLSADEISDIHARVGTLVVQYVDFEQPLLTSFWVLPYGFLVVLIGLAYLRFLFRLPRRTAILFVISGLLFVSGAIGMEVIESRYIINGGSFDLYFMVLVTIEELMELSGIVLFLFACLEYYRTQFGDVRFKLRT